MDDDDDDDEEEEDEDEDDEPDAESESASESCFDSSLLSGASVATTSTSPCLNCSLISASLVLGFGRRLFDFQYYLDRILLQNHNSQQTNTNNNNNNKKNYNII